MRPRKKVLKRKALNHLLIKKNGSIRLRSGRTFRAKWFKEIQIQNDPTKITKAFVNIVGNIDTQAKLRKYYRFKYDAQDNLIYYHFTIQGLGSYDKITIRINYKDGEVIEYWDSLGNEWSRGWGCKNPFVLRIKQMQNTLKAVEECVENVMW